MKAYKNPLGRKVISFKDEESAYILDITFLKLD